MMPKGIELKTKRQKAKNSTTEAQRSQSKRTSPFVKGGTKGDLFLSL